MPLRPPLLSLLAALSAWASSSCNAAFFLDFTGGVWDHTAVGGPAASTGWAVDASTGTNASNRRGYSQGATEVEPGVFATVTSTFVFPSAPPVLPGIRNLTANPVNTPGFAIQNRGLNDDNGASLTRYQRLNVSFSASVMIESLDVRDIDTASSSGTQVWRDTVALELWQGQAPTTPGQGIQPTISFATTTNLTLDNSTYSIPFVWPTTLGNTQSLPRSTAFYSSSEVIDGITLYLWDRGLSNTNGSHAVVLEASGTRFVVVPEPGTVAFGALALAMGSMRRRRH